MPCRTDRKNGSSGNVGFESHPRRQTFLPFLQCKTTKSLSEKPRSPRLVRRFQSHPRPHSRLTLPTIRPRSRLLRCLLLVVLFVGDLTAGAVLLPIDLLPLRWCQFASVRGAVHHLPVDVLLSPLHLRRLSRRQLPAANALGDSLLLQSSPLTHLIISILRIRGIVFVVVDRLAQLILLPVHLLPFLRRQRYPSACLSVWISPFSFAWRPSRFFVSPAVRLPKLTPFAMRPC